MSAPQTNAVQTRERQMPHDLFLKRFELFSYTKTLLRKLETLRKICATVIPYNLIDQCDRLSLPNRVEAMHF